MTDTARLLAHDDQLTLSHALLYLLAPGDLFEGVELTATQILVGKPKLERVEAPRDLTRGHLLSEVQNLQSILKILVRQEVTKPRLTHALACNDEDKLTVMEALSRFVKRLKRCPIPINPFVVL